MNNVVISGMDGNEVWRRCKEKIAQGYIEVEPFHKVYNTAKQYNTRVNSNPKLNRTTFAGVEERTKYRAVYRKGGNNQ